MKLYPSPSETPINTGDSKGMMKGEGYFAYSISENWKQHKQQLAYCFMTGLNAKLLTYLVSSHAAHPRTISVEPFLFNDFIM